MPATPDIQKVTLHADNGWCVRVHRREKVTRVFCYHPNGFTKNERIGVRFNAQFKHIQQSTPERKGLYLMRTIARFASTSDHDFRYVMAYWDGQDWHERSTLGSWYFHIDMQSRAAKALTYEWAGIPDAQAKKFEPAVLVTITD